MAVKQQFDVVVLGATGFTGRLACEYLASHAPPGLRWAMAGRSIERLEAFRKELPDSSQTIPLLQVDVGNSEQLKKIALQSKVIANFAGTPYSDKALPVVDACASSGCCYVDITGEVPFMKTSAIKYDAKAKKTGALIVHACGFDSVPSDLGAFLAAKTMRSRHGMACDRIRAVLLDSKGGVSGGTLHSALYILTKGRTMENADAMTKSYGLDPPGSRGGPDTGDFGSVGVLPAFDEDLEAWCVPFVMASVNARVVRCSNALSGYSYGESTSYGEVQAVPGPLTGAAAVAGLGLGLAALSLPPTRFALCKWVLPEPGQGPSRALQNTGYFRMKVVAIGERLPGDERPAPKVVVNIDSKDAGDPGYKCTARMAIEAALCCALEREKCLASGGVVTPAFGLAQTLVDRLVASGMQFSSEAP